MSFPGPQKNKMEFFVHHLYREHRGREFSKEEILSEAEAFQFAPDIQVFFEELSQKRFGEEELIDSLNEVIRRRGRAEAVGGLLEKRQQIPPEWEQAYQEEYQSR